MGIYLNGMQPYTLYKEAVTSPYFVDKTAILAEIIPLIGKSTKYICITRPRRFGKTVMANLIAAFLSKGKTSDDLFSHLFIGKNQEDMQFLNSCNVIYISFNELPRECISYHQYIKRIENRLITDLYKAYPHIKVDPEEAVWDLLSDIYAENVEQFVFVLDEWDFIFHRDFVTENGKKDFINFLSNLLKDKPYVSLAYMTGILPIAKYSSGSELNMFTEFTMAKSPAFGDYFGFTEKEVDDLYDRYKRNCPAPSVSREGLKNWYDGYQTAAGEQVYNPRSVVQALSFNNLANYWTSSGPYDEIFYYIRNNVADVRDDLALMAAGEAVPAKVEEYAATSMNLQTRDEIFSAMVVYGFLSYQDGMVRIPNKELMDRFSTVLLKEESLGYVNRLARQSERMLAATLSGDVDTMAEILSFTHDSEVPLMNYNSEAELSAVVNLAYLSARDIYDIQREDKSGIGYVDFIFYPKYRRDADCIILELKIDQSPEAAISQIREKRYDMRLKGKLGEQPRFTGRILAVGISYDKKSKKHACKVQVL